LAPHLALAVLRLETAIESGEFDVRPIDDELIEILHRRLCAELIPSMAGWRRLEVVVGTHAPPVYHRVPLLVREYGRDLQARLAALPVAPPEILLETLAFAEGRLLSIHPFVDFNGRLTRVLLRLLLRRLDLPWVDLLPPDGGKARYLDALSAADRNDWRPLMTVWRERFERGVVE
jgi:CRISPR-associated endonuclease/helicase Cas3